MAATMNAAAAAGPSVQTGGGLLPSFLSVPLDSPPKLLYGLVVVILIVFVDQVPAYVRDIADSMLGRLIGMGVVVIVTMYGGWPYGLLTALAFLLLVRGARRLSGVADESQDTSPLMAFLGIGGPSYKSTVPQGPYAADVTTEGFQAQLVAEAVGNRWYVERVLGENPLGIVTTTAETMSVQDLSQKNMGSRK
jgi:hypothetical protein